MTPDQVERLAALEHCRFLPGSFDKRFVRDLVAAVAADPAKELTGPQASHLERLAWKYRRQLPAHLVPAEAPATAP